MPVVFLRLLNKLMRLQAAEGKMPPNWATVHPLRMRTSHPLKSFWHASLASRL